MATSRQVHNEVVRGLRRSAVIVLLLTGVTACARLHARTQPDGPPLETPQPPPRVIVPVESEPIGSGTPPTLEAPGRRTSREAPPAAAPSKPESAAPAPPASHPTPDAASARTLQTTGKASETEQQIRALLANAARDLSRIDYRALSADAKAQYDVAKRFSEQADEALKAKNLVFAGQLADKAAALAALLLKR